jgi:hypothetical protein
MSKSIGKVAAVVSPATAAATSLLNAGKRRQK